MQEKGTKVVESVVAKTCDRCGFRADNEHGVFELQEFMSWRDTCGYGNLWKPEWGPEKPYGDGDYIAIDLCQRCVYEVLGRWIRVEGSVFRGT